jgi:hypothetical protein
MRPKRIPKAPTPPPPEVDTIAISLIVPSLDLQIDTSLDPSQSAAAIRHLISTALRTSLAFIYTMNGEPVDDFTNLEPRTKFLIGTGYFGSPLFEDRRREVRMQVLVIQPGPATDSWAELSTAEKIEHIASLKKTEKGRNTTYLALTLDEAKKGLENLPSRKAARAAWEVNWGQPIDAILGLQGLVMPSGDPKTWDINLVGALGVLSEVLVGQGHGARDMILDLLVSRGRKIIEVKDARDLGEWLFDEAMKQK